MRDCLAVTKALADPSRLRILHALRRGELCVCQIMGLLGLAPSTVSKHLSILYQARLVESRKEGRWMYYRLPVAEESPAAAVDAIAWVHRHLGADPQILTDTKRIAAILSCSPEAPCPTTDPNDSACCSSAPATPVAARWPKDGRET